MGKTNRKTIVGDIDERVLAFTAGNDADLDLHLAEIDCIGTAAHVTMLARAPVRPALFSAAQRQRVIAELVRIMRRIRTGEFRILPEDQDVHMAVERLLTAALGDLGRRVHTARSRNDQAAVDLRLYGKTQLLGMLHDTLDLAGVLIALARRHATVPMVGRTHLQPAMPSTVGVWAAAHAESLLDDVVLLRAAYEVCDRSPLGSAAGYGVPFPVDRALTARLLGFRDHIRDVVYAGNSRGKLESVVLSAALQVMLTLSRLAEDLVLFCMPEFGYFSLPGEFGTGSSIMPQKNNPDVLELVRGRAARFTGRVAEVTAVTCKLPSGYSRDLQETKEPFIAGLATARGCLQVLAPLIRALRVNRAALAAGFSEGVFATDRVLELVARGVPFRTAYQTVKQDHGGTRQTGPGAAARRFALGGPADPDLRGLAARVRSERRDVNARQAAFHRSIARLLGTAYPPAPETAGRA
jgi:argininosuccinate lyase